MICFSRKMSKYKYIRAFNSALAFTSMGEKVDETIQNRQGGACTFRIQGGLYHRI
jgi:hypothetical protein